MKLRTFLLASLFLNTIFLSQSAISTGHEPEIFKYNSSNILHLDVEDTEIRRITSFISNNFDTNVLIDPEIAHIRITTRCETGWFDALLQISAENNLDLVETNSGILLRKKYQTNINGS